MLLLIYSLILKNKKYIGKTHYNLRSNLTGKKYLVKDYLMFDIKKIFKRHGSQMLFLYVIPAILAIICIGSAIYTLLTYNASFTILPYSHTEPDSIAPRAVVLNA